MPLSCARDAIRGARCGDDESQMRDFASRQREFSVFAGIDALASRLRMDFLRVGTFTRLVLEHPTAAGAAGLRRDEAMKGLYSAALTVVVGLAAQLAAPGEACARDKHVVKAGKRSAVAAAQARPRARVHR